jgi:hypothetical protein
MSQLSFFNYIRRLDPLYNRLASLLFLQVLLYNKEGCNTLYDIITLYKENLKVAYRLSL